MARRAGGTFVLLLSAIAGAAILVAAADPPTDEDRAHGRADVAYEGQATVQGQLSGSCEGRGIDYTKNQPGNLTFYASEPTLVLRRHYSNHTRVEDYWTADDVGSDEEFFTMPSGRYEAKWPATGSATIFQHGYGDYPSPITPFNITLETSDLSTGPLASSPDGTGEVLTRMPMGILVPRTPSFPGWGRHVNLGDSFAAHGPMTLRLAHATVLTPAGEEIRLPEWKTRTQTMDFVVGEKVYVERVDAWLMSPDARIDVAAGTARPVCGPMQLQGTGSWTISEASGNAHRGAERFDFEERVVTVSGGITWSEYLAPKPGDDQGRIMQADASGDLYALTLDFDEAALAPLPPAGDALQVAGLGILMAGIVAWIATHTSTIVGAFYARFGPEKALRHPRRLHCLKFVEENPGTGLMAMSRTTGIPRNSLRHHLRVLKRIGKVRLVRENGALRAWPPAPATPAAVKGRAEEGPQPRRETKAIVLQLQRGPQRLSDLAATMAESFNVSVRTARRWIERARAEGFVGFESISGRGSPVVVTCLE